MLKVKNLSVAYGNLQALDKINLEVDSGQIVSIIGANGAGKSTLLKSISGLIRGFDGSVVFDGHDISSLSPSRIVNQGISHVLEGRQLFASLSTLDNLNLGAYIYKSPRFRAKVEESREKIFEIFPILKERASQFAGTLSGGEQQMLAIGRALMAKPRLLLLDEPSLGLAPRIVQDIFSVIRELNQQGVTILLVEQNARLALSSSDFAYVLETGNKILEGSGEDLLSDDMVQQAYLGAAKTAS
jgi:branched-chain amino acid transport system ATP-binding protein